MKQLTEKERLFCRMYAMYGSGEEAARLAGYSHPENKWRRLTARDDIMRETARAAQESRAMLGAMSVSGLYRLAFGDNTDAVRLCFSGEEILGRLSELDLYGISEIKRTDKGVEIKFCDRIKALEKLGEILHAEAQDNSPSGLIDALRTGARALSDKRGEADGI